MNKIFSRGGVIPPLVFILLALSLVSCRSQGTSGGAETIADAFVQAYYVDTNIKAALAYCNALACKTLQDELALREGQKIASDTMRPHITAKQTKTLEEAGGAKRFLYDLKVKASGLEAFHREAFVKLRQVDGVWKVTHFAELK